jgi:hypothetical protein
MQVLSCYEPLDIKNKYFCHSFYQIYNGYPKEPLTIGFENPHL